MSLSVIANQCFAIDEKGLTHEVEGFGARPQDPAATPNITLNNDLSL